MTGQPARRRPGRKTRRRTILWSREGEEGSCVCIAGHPYMPQVLVFTNTFCRAILKWRRGVLWATSLETIKRTLMRVIPGDILENLAGHI